MVKNREFPLVSIIIPVYNGANFLEEAIISALKQDYPNVEILVINDGSNDSGLTTKILERYRDKVQIYEKANGGVASALNLGLAKMKGDFFSWLSHDDLYYESKISDNYEAYLSQGKHKVIIYSDYLVFSEENPKGYLEEMRRIDPSNFRHWLLTKSQLHGCTLFIPKDAFLECGNFNEDLRTVQDYDLWFRMAKKYDFVYQNRCLVRFRIHPNQDSNKLGSIALGECNIFYENSTLELSLNEVIRGSETDLKSGLESMLINFEQRGWRIASQNLSQKMGVPVVTGNPIRNLLQRILKKLIHRI
jgi:glycosyltransferase involved in cell wall biosynthesis